VHRNGKVSWRLIGVLVLVLLFVVVVLQNTQVVRSQLFFWTLSMPRIILLFFALLVGFAVGYCATGRDRGREKSYLIPRAKGGRASGLEKPGSGNLRLARTRIETRETRAGLTKPVGKRSTLVTVGVLGVAAVCLLIGLFGANHAPNEVIARGIQLMPARTEDGGQEVPFALVAPNATDVSVLGDFNLWEPTALSEADGDGVWRTSMFLPLGRYEYAFLVDGRWWGQDPLADEYVRSFGEFSSVRYVGGGDGA